ncbi:hypothetical protein KCU62_g2651, partial [Aureobasidium sp. EXF-3399]
MRICTVVFWTFVLGLQWNLVLTQTNERTPLCIRLEEEGHHLTPEQANNTVGPWAKGQYEEWNKTKTHDEFWHWLHVKWAPDAADTIIGCRLSGTCSTVSCFLIARNYSIQDQWSAYWTLESITTFHNMAYEIRGANHDAWARVRSDVGTLVAKFSDGSNIEAHKLKDERHWKLAGHIVLGVAALLSAIGIFLSATIGIGSMISLAATQKALEDAMVPEQIRMASASAGLFNTAGTTALTFGTDLIDPSKYVSTMKGLLDHSQKENQERIVDRFDAYLKGLFEGRDPSLPYLVQRGAYVKATRVLTPEHNKELEQRWAASYISSIWNIEKTYIVMSDTGNCKSDSRGYKPLRVCLDEEPDYVFYAFSRSRVREGVKHKALVRGPIGHANLHAVTNFTLTDVVRASLVYSRRNGYSVSTGAPEGKEDIVDSFFGAKSVKDGGVAHGLFNIPILYSPGGQAISSINSKYNRNYPCMAARLPWSKNNHLQPRDVQGPDEKWTENDNTTMFQFMNATGFCSSDDWWEYCTDDGSHHGNHCKGNKDINWRGLFGKDQYDKIQHPFKSCKARKGEKHGFVGCERPHNDGYKQNKPGDCGGKHMVAEGFVASDTQWLNGTAPEADDMDEDEGDLSEWTDEETGGNDDGDNDSGEATDQDGESRVRTSNGNTNGIASRFHA